LRKPKNIDLLKESVKQYSLQAIKAVLDGAASDLHNSRTVGEADSPSMWSHPSLSEPITKCWNYCIKVDVDDGQL